MSSSPRPPRSAALWLVLIVSGWALAAILAGRAWLAAPGSLEPAPEPKPLAPVAAESRVAQLFREFSSDPRLAGALIGFCLLDEKGEPLFASPLAERALCPASALKTATTGAALSLLGPEFRFETPLVASAPLDAAGAIAGDLVLVGGGDPTLSVVELEKLADEAVAAGLKKVAGKLRVDASIFPPDPVSEHWNWGDIGNAYGAGAYGLNVEHNRLSVRFAPGANPGAPATLLGGRPALRDLRWENHVRTGAPDSGDGVVVFSQPYGRAITLRGTVPAGAAEFTITAAQPDPPALAAELLRARLMAAGVSIADGAGPFAAGAPTTLASHLSAALPEIIDHLHEVSDNLEAQCLFLTIGRRQQMAPERAVQEFWEKAGVSFVALRLLDGNGLARANMIRPLDLARINLAARRGPHGARFFQSLSTYADGKIRGKIGGMSGVKTLVGFLQTASGRELTFAAFGNGLPSGRFYWKRQEDFLTAVAAVH